MQIGTTFAQRVAIEHRERRQKRHELNVNRYRQYFWLYQILGWVGLVATGLYWLIVGSPPPIGPLAAGGPTFCFFFSAFWFIMGQNEQKKANELKPPLTEDAGGTSHG